MKIYSSLTQCATMKYVIILKVKGKIYDKNGKEIELKL